MADPQSNAAVPAYRLPESAPSAGVIHIRHRHTSEFVVVGNHLAQHEGLSATALGLAVHILSLPDGAAATVKALAHRFPEGEILIRRALNELVRTGYLERRRVPLGGGRFATRTFAYDKPDAATRLDRSPPSVSPPARHPERPQAASAVEPGHAGPGLRGSGRLRMPGAPVSPAGSRTDRPRLPEPRPDAEAPATPLPPPGGDHPSPSPRPPDDPATGPAAGLLAGLRLLDPRLLLSCRDIARLAPAVDTWLDRAVAPDQITRTLTAGLPSDRIHHPAGLLEHRLTSRLPPPLPPDAPAPHRPAPLHTCDGCERAFRTHDPTARCADCRTDGTKAVA